jgi:hypothetical protein
MTVYVMPLTRRGSIFFLSNEWQLALALTVPAPLAASVSDHPGSVEKP